MRSLVAGPEDQPPHPVEIPADIFAGREEPLPGAGEEAPPRRELIPRGPMRFPIRAGRNFRRAVLEMVAGILWTYALCWNYLEGRSNVPEFVVNGVATALVISLLQRLVMGKFRGGREILLLPKSITLQTIFGSKAIPYEAVTRILAPDEYTAGTTDYLRIEAGRRVIRIEDGVDVENYGLLLRELERRTGRPIEFVG